MTLWNTLSPCIFGRYRPLSVAANTASPDVFVVAKIQNACMHAVTDMCSDFTASRVTRVHAVHCYSTFQASLNMPRVQYRSQ